MSMREAAEAYCCVIEGAADMDRPTFVREASRTLAAAVAAAYRLSPDDWSSDPGDEEIESMAYDSWFVRMSALQDVLDEWENYWTTWNAYRLEEIGGRRRASLDDGGDHALNLSLSDALADIWSDLRPGLDALDRGVPETRVAWEWWFQFTIHWGNHAVEALRALHHQRAAEASRSE